MLVDEICISLLKKIIQTEVYYAEVSNLGK